MLSEGKWREAERGAEVEVAFLSGSVGGSCRTGYAEFKQLLNSDFQRGEVHDRDVSKRRESRDCGMWAGDLGACGKIE